MNSEMQSRKLLFAGICLQLGTGYTVGFIVYQIGTLIQTGSTGAGFAAGLAAVAVFALIIALLIVRGRSSVTSKYRLERA